MRMKKIVSGRSALPSALLPRKVSVFSVLLSYLYYVRVLTYPEDREHDLLVRY